MIELLKPAVPVLSLVVLYLFAVLPMAVGWGARAGGGTIGWMLAFNFFFLPPLYTFTLADGGTGSRCRLLVTAVVVSELPRGRGARRSSRRCWPRSPPGCWSTATSAPSWGGSGRRSRRVLRPERVRIELATTTTPRRGRPPTAWRWAPALGRRDAGGAPRRGGARLHASDPARRSPRCWGWPSTASGSRRRGARGRVAARAATP